jgi:hypothetical protein
VRRRQLQRQFDVVLHRLHRLSGQRVHQVEIEVVELAPGGLDRCQRLRRS